MKIIHIITGLSIGGAEQALYNLLKGGLAERFDNCVISLRDKGPMGLKISLLGVPVIALNMHAKKLPLAGLVKLIRIIREFSPDLIQGWMYHGNLIGGFSRVVAPGKPALVWNVRHSLSDLSQEKIATRQVIRINRWFSFGADVILYNSHRSREQHEVFGFSKVGAKVIPNGIDTHIFSFSSKDRKHIRSKLGIPENACVVGHMARLHPMKDHAIFIQAAKSLSYRYQNLYFLLSGRDVSFDNIMLSQLLSSQVRHRFYFLGERNDVHKLMSAIDIFCLSSAWGEGFPNVLGEAMATSIPCVATDIGDSALVVNKTGIIVPPCDVNALEEGIESLLTISSEDRISLGRSALERVEVNYKLSKIVEKYASLYNELAKIS
jgi:glycosyltransferase involved in cell wall biosynthesis